MAIKAYNMLANGMGGIDWAGLPIAVERFGFTNVDLLLHQLQVIRSHQATRPSDADEED